MKHARHKTKNLERCWPFSHFVNSVLVLKVPDRAPFSQRKYLPAACTRSNSSSNKLSEVKDKDAKTNSNHVRKPLLLRVLRAPAWTSGLVITGKHRVDSSRQRRPRCSAANCLNFFFSSCRARSRLWRSSKRLVVGQLFSGCKRTGEMQKAGCLQIAETKTSPKTVNTNPTREDRRHPEN